MSVSSLGRANSIALSAPDRGAVSCDLSSDSPPAAASPAFHSSHHSRLGRPTPSPGTRSTVERTCRKFPIGPTMLRVPSCARTSFVHGTHWRGWDREDSQEKLVVGLSSTNAACVAILQHSFSLSCRLRSARSGPPVQRRSPPTRILHRTSRNRIVKNTDHYFRTTPWFLAPAVFIAHLLIPSPPPSTSRGPLKASKLRAAMPSLRSALGGLRH
ncbi:hypothetical protein E2C01_017244 [Portunus trituberculatus]|uniref:Uncharacterized protein n=1 Tax=Portunus trituberculatus TaxID=210409 RepID=A0A5B7DSN0_PORTR|nr:hypothetical protein [Portunus trituberculatus]